MLPLALTLGWSGIHVHSLHHQGNGSNPRVLRASHPHNATPWCCIDPSPCRIQTPPTCQKLRDVTPRGVPRGGHTRTRETHRRIFSYFFPFVSSTSTTFFSILSPSFERTTSDQRCHVCLFHHARFNVSLLPSQHHPPVFGTSEQKVMNHLTSN